MVECVTNIGIPNSQLFLSPFMYNMGAALFSPGGNDDDWNDPLKILRKLIVRAGGYCGGYIAGPPGAGAGGVAGGALADQSRTIAQSQKNGVYTPFGYNFEFEKIKQNPRELKNYSGLFSLFLTDVKEGLDASSQYKDLKM